ncbi:diguanylate cyclase [Paenibacillus flagellatus]|uniref:histidine kinase n=1 Tax=Paenibacillus flagellatus TaxID=2211139 RepID=A0A2V5K8Q9_9BACL|nr:diguanylate cyclase [Paenibacillus flagellatus]PYI55915.1 hypothetical protein DLM86_09400 [Paenibacillus flagellatus]
MNPIRSFRRLRPAAIRTKDTLFAALVLFAGAGAVADAFPDWIRLAASIAFAGLLLAVVCWRKKRKAAYGLSSVALLLYVTVIQPDELFAALLIVYPLLLFYALLLPSPLYTLAAALAVGLHLYAFADLSGRNGLVAHLLFITLNALAYTILARYTRKLEKERNEYRHLSMIDSLTGLASLQQTLMFGQRLIDEGKTVRVLLIDLNFFKQINDSYGHMIGNKVILLVADYLRELIRGSNGIAGRLGGDEFVIVAEDAPRFADMRQKLLDELNGRTFVPDDDLPPVCLSFSVGVSVSSGESASSIEELLHDADLNMYEYKMHNRMPTFDRKTSDLIEHNPDPICTFDRKGKLLAVNPAAAKLLGYTLEEMGRRPFVALIHPQDRAKALSGFQETMQGNPSQFELRFLHKEGHPVIAHVTYIPIIADHRIVGVYGVAKDVTHERKAEELLRNSERLAVMGQLAAGLAHEIRNPLTALKGFIQLLQSAPGDNKGYFPIMLTELDRINFILNEFLLLSKPRPTQFRETDIRVVLEHVVTLLDTQAILNKVRIAIEAEEDVPPIRCDENQMKQVFVNVLKNAIEAMPDGGEVTVCTFRTEKGVSVRIADQGGGIPEELLPRLGQPFLTTKEKGTGLGLMICRNIMDNHNGTLTIRNGPERGTIVDIELPAAAGG